MRSSLRSALDCRAPPYKRTLHVRLTHYHIIAEGIINKLSGSYCIISCKRNLLASTTGTCTRTAYSANLSTTLLQIICGFYYTGRLNRMLKLLAILWVTHAPRTVTRPSGRDVTHPAAGAPSAVSVFAREKHTKLMAERNKILYLYTYFFS